MPSIDDLVISDALNAYFTILRRLEHGQQIKKRDCEKLELIIAKEPFYSYKYALEIIKGRWPKGEEIIKTNPNIACNYATRIIKGRWPEAEETILKHRKNCFHYAKHIIEGRWIEAEEIIATDDPNLAYEYAMTIVKGKLPENMHNIMLIHALNESEAAKSYFKFIEQ